MTTPNRYNMQYPNDKAKNSYIAGAQDKVHGYGMGKGAAKAAPTPDPYKDAPRSAQGQAAMVQPGTKKKRSKGFWIGIIVAIVCVVVAILLALTMCDTVTKGARQGDMGQLDGKTQEEIQAELDRVVEEGMFNISIASTVQFPSGSSAGELRIENVPSNHYLMKVVITRDDTGEQIYETDLIEPNHHIQADTLDVDLSAGDYDCTAVFYAYDEETEELIGQAAAKIDIEVQS